VTIRLEVFDNDQWADRVAHRWVMVMQRNPTARLCLPTGETPRPVYAVAASVMDLDAATVFILDEFGLPPGDSARCDAMLQRDLLDLLTHQPRAIHGLDPAAPDPDAECRRFASLVADGGLDLTLLGLGGNGHLGLNEPGTAVDAPTSVTRLASSTTRAASRYGVDAEPTWGMTLGMQAIFASKEIWLLVTGSHKADILDRTLNGPIGPDVPATYLRDHPNAVVFADRAAAGR
jgi:glucosamine-6-phosphate deaminase